MALVATSLSSAIQASGQAIYPGSQIFPLLATAIGNAVVSWATIPTNVLVQGVVTGTAGAGNVLGKFQVVSGGQLAAAFTAGGVVGVAAQGVASAIEQGVSSTFNSSAQYQGIATGVGVGADVSKVVVSNAGTLISLLVANFQGNSIRGVTSSQLATVVGNGVSSLVQTGFGFGNSTGNASPISASGTSISRLL